jgi:hypothetical protein
VKQVEREVEQKGAGTQHDLLYSGETWEVR